MIRRRRISREIPFSFDSFLDVVANVVGIIIRLILVVWVGARSYSSIKDLPPPPADFRPETVEKVEAAEESPAAPETETADPLHDELARHRRELVEAQSRLLDQLRQVEMLQKDQGQVRGELGTLQT